MIMSLSLFSAAAFANNYHRQFPSHKITNLTLRKSSSDIHSETNSGHRDISVSTETSRLIGRLKDIRSHVVASEKSNNSQLTLCHESHVVGATNMIHYLAMKQIDYEHIEEDAASIGLLNLQTSRLHILASLAVAIRVLNPVSSNPSIQIRSNIAGVTVDEMRKNALSNRNRIFVQGSTTRIMVTVGEEAAKNETLVTELLDKGADVFRINCAHGNPSIWSTVIGNIRRASSVLEKPCRILVDLAGPKLRTGPPVEESVIQLRIGDTLIISRDSSPKIPPECGTYMITCMASYLFEKAQIGDSIAFSDGKIWGVVKGASETEITVSITRTALKGYELGKNKSINLPNRDIPFKGLTSKDLTDLDFVASMADMVGFSFVQDVRDIESVQNEMKNRGLDNLGIVLKIETRSAVENLPRMLLEAMKSGNPIGVMIARGDLAVECGWEELADLQEEILTVCCAAHVPVIWATQVLDSLVKAGVPSRPEITDAACGRRASCVMLNRGANIVEAVSTLKAILRRDTPKTRP